MQLKTPIHVSLFIWFLIFFDFLPLKNAVNNFMEPHEGWGEEEKRGNETNVEAKCSRQARGDLYFKCKHAIEEEVELNCYTCK